MEDLENRVEKLEFDLLNEKPVEHHHVHHTEKNDKEDTTSLYLWFLVPIFLLIFVGILGPWYSDCNNNKCSTQRDYGIYCDDYCIYGNYGVGTSTFLFFIVLVGIMWCWLIK